jgi:hypothetical protein
MPTIAHARGPTRMDACDQILLAAAVHVKVHSLDGGFARGTICAILAPTCTSNRGRGSGSRRLVGQPHGK